MGNASANYVVLPREEATIELERITGVTEPRSPIAKLTSKEIRRLLTEGQALAALEAVSLGYPELMVPGSAVYLSLHSQVFIEYVRAGDLGNALKFAQERLSGYKDSLVRTPSQAATVRDLTGLLCFQDPSKSAVKFLMTQAQRKVAAKVVGEAVSLRDSSRRGWCCQCLSWSKCLPKPRGQ